jgi:hypothetical protein
VSLVLFFLHSGAAALTGLAGDVVRPAADSARNPRLNCHFHATTYQSIVPNIVFPRAVVADFPPSTAVPAVEQKPVARSSSAASASESGLLFALSWFVCWFVEK